MIYLFRVLVLLAAINFTSLSMYSGDKRMLIIWAAVMLGAGIVSIKKYYRKVFDVKWIKAVLLTGVILFAGVEGCIVIEGFKQPAAKSDYVIVLGSKAEGNRPSRSLQYRLDTALDYLKANPDTQVVVSGGQGKDEILPEAHVMHDYLVQHGIAEERIIVEDESHNTYQNLKNSFKLIDQEKPNADIVVVTNRFHILRAKILGKRLGRKLQGLGASCYLPLIVNDYTREFFGVLSQAAYFIK